MTLESVEQRRVRIEVCAGLDERCEDTFGMLKKKNVPAVNGL